MGIFISFSTFALESFERLTNVKLLRILPENIIVLNRGIEDGITKNNHAKISSEVSGFISRAICVKVSSELSYWKVYRIPNSEAFSLDNTYIITGIGDREIPLPQEEWRFKEISIKEQEKKDEKVIGPDPFNVNRDLPDTLTERDLIETSESDRKKYFIEKNFDKHLIKKDLSNYLISIYASPFMKQSINQGESLRYGFKGSNVSSKYRLMTQFEQQQTKLTDPVTNESVSTRSTQGQAQFIINRLTPSVSSLSLIHYNSQRFSSLATPAAHWQFGMVGFTWHLFENKSWEYVDLSYVPLYDWRKTEVLKNGTIEDQKRSGLRHGLRLGLKKMINERVAIENLLWVRPYQDLTNWQIESGNLNLSNDFKLIFGLTSKLFFDYNFIYQKDKLWKTLSGLPESNAINSINLRYDFNL